MFFHHSPTKVVDTAKGRMAAPIGLAYAQQHMVEEQGFVAQGRRQGEPALMCRYGKGAFRWLAHEESHLCGLALLVRPQCVASFTAGRGGNHRVERCTQQHLVGWLIYRATAHGVVAARPAAQHQWLTGGTTMPAAYFASVCRVPTALSLLAETLFTTWPVRPAGIT